MNKKIERITVYEFEEPVIGGIPGEKRKIAQSCIVYNDGSMKNILVDNSDWDEATRKAYFEEYDSYVTEFLSSESSEFRKKRSQLEAKSKVVQEEMQMNQMDEDDLSSYISLCSEYDEAKKESLQKMFASRKISVTTGEDFIENFEDYRSSVLSNTQTSTQTATSENFEDNCEDYPFYVRKKESKTPKKEEKKEKEAKKKKAKKEKKKTWVQKIWTKIMRGPAIVKTIAAGVIGFGILSSARAIDRFKGDHSTKKEVVRDWSDINNKEKTAVDQNIDPEIDYANMYMDELIECTTHDKAREAQNSIWMYLNYSNDTLAERLLEKGKTSRFMLKYKEVFASYIAYNADSLYQDDFNHIVGDTSLSEEKLNKAYDRGMKEETLAYVASKKPIDKNVLFITEEGKEFHEKYAKLVANMASAKGKEEKREASASFRKSLKKEITRMEDEKEENSRIPSYKSSITPIVKAAEMICKRDHLDPILTEKEQEHFDKLLLRDQVKEDFEEFTRDLKDYQQIKEEAENAIDIATSTANKDPNLDDFALAAECELTAEGIYYEDDRDIRDHSVFESAKEEKEKKDSSKSTSSKKQQESKEAVEGQAIKEEPQLEEDTSLEESQINKQEELQKEIKEEIENESQEQEQEETLPEETELEGENETKEENETKDESFPDSEENATTEEENSDNEVLQDPEEVPEEETREEEEPSEEAEYISPEEAPNIIEEEVPIELIADTIISRMESSTEQSKGVELIKRI